MIDRPLAPRRAPQPARFQSLRGSARPSLYWSFAAALILLAGCGGENPPAATGAAPVPAVTVVPVRKESVEEQIQFVGRVAAVDRVELQARVQGFLKEKRFSEGQQVEVGQVLFVIEPDQYQAVVTQREADLAKAVADEENARAQLARGQELVKQKNIAQSKVDELPGGGVHRQGRASPRPRRPWMRPSWTLATRRLRPRLRAASGFPNTRSAIWSVRPAGSSPPS